MGINFDIITVIHQASITDWIQAIAALLAVIGTVATLWKLYQRDEQKQAMIGELKQQTKHFGAQVEQLGAQVFQLSKIHEAIGKGIEVLTQNAEVQEMNRRNELRPVFTLQTSMDDEGIVDSGKLFVFRNRGGTAMNIRAIWCGDVVAQVSVLTSRVEKGGDLRIRIVWKDQGADRAISFNLHYEDTDGVAYRQEAHSENDFYIHLNDPVMTDQAQYPKRKMDEQ